MNSKMNQNNNMKTLWITHIHRDPNRVSKSEEWLVPKTGQEDFVVNPKQVINDNVGDDVTTILLSLLRKCTNDNNSLSNNEYTFKISLDTNGVSEKYIISSKRLHTPRSSFD